MLISLYMGLATEAERKLEQYRTEAMLSRMTSTAPSSPLPKWQKLLTVFVSPLRLERAGSNNDVSR